MLLCELQGFRFEPLPPLQKQPPAQQQTTASGPAATLAAPDGAAEAPRAPFTSSGTLHQPPPAAPRKRLRVTLDVRSEVRWCPSTSSRSHLRLPAKAMQHLGIGASTDCLASLPGGVQLPARVDFEPTNKGRGAIAAQFWGGLSGALQLRGDQLLSVRADSSREAFVLHMRVEASPALAPPDASQQPAAAAAEPAPCSSAARQQPEVAALPAPPPPTGAQSTKSSADEARGTGPPPQPSAQRFEAPEQPRPPSPPARPTPVRVCAHPRKCATDYTTLQHAQSAPSEFYTLWPVNSCKVRWNRIVAPVSYATKHYVAPGMSHQSGGHAEKLPGPPRACVR